jgi:hypothetical protein
MAHHNLDRSTVTMTTPAPLTADDAAHIAGPWALQSRPDGGGRVRLYEFDLGFVACPVPPAPLPSLSEGSPAVVGAPRAVIDKYTGELTVMPSLSPTGVAELYRSYRRGDNRFPGVVREVLACSGWTPGRNVSGWIAQWEATLNRPSTALGLDAPLSTPARAALSEFGGLRLQRNGIALAVWPDAGPIHAHRYQRLAACLKAPVGPFARFHDGVSDLAVAADGRVFLLGIAEQSWVADRIDEALIVVLLGIRVPDPLGSAVDPRRPMGRASGDAGRPRQARPRRWEVTAAPVHPAATHPEVIRPRPPSSAEAIRGQRVIPAQTPRRMEAPTDDVT